MLIYITQPWSSPRSRRSSNKVMGAKVRELKHPYKGRKATSHRAAGRCSEPKQADHPEFYRSCSMTQMGYVRTPFDLIIVGDDATYGRRRPSSPQAVFRSSDRMVCWYEFRLVVEMRCGWYENVIPRVCSARRASSTGLRIIALRAQ
jgi:hypothetical protein